MVLNLNVNPDTFQAVAGSLNGVPHATPAASLLFSIIAVCQKNPVHRVSSVSAPLLASYSTTIDQRKSRRLAGKATLLVTVLQDQTCRLEGAEIHKSVDGLME